MLRFDWIKKVMLQFYWIKKVMLRFDWIKKVMLQFNWIIFLYFCFVFPFRYTAIYERSASI